MDDETFWGEVGTLPAFAAAVEVLTIQSVSGSLGTIDSNDQTAVAWGKALLAASLVSRDAPEAIYEGALRIAQGCLQSSSSGELHKEAARVLLERLGNFRSVDLAIDKGLLAQVPTVSSPWLSMDSIRTDLELSIPLRSGELLRGNDFQVRFWDAASTSNWVSASAPTSVGKSYIVRRWLEERSNETATFACAYLVPTRALIDEVSRDLRETLASDLDVFSLPWDKRIAESSRRIFVLTQERMHALQQADPSLKVDVVFVDEAQKFGDGSRGVLLQRVLDEMTSRNPAVHVLFASPATSNPEILLREIQMPNEVVVSKASTVNQNLIYAEQEFGSPQDWRASVMIGGALQEVGKFRLSARPQPEGKRLALVAAALGAKSGSNVVYANGPAEAEKIAEQLFEVLGESAARTSPAIEEARELIEKTIHPQYALRKHLTRGVAFHYGNMPLLLREEVERLFRSGDVQFLICTSTLLEGVNLPCQNIFLRSPRKGRGRPMPASDFWNLAGRAGRWGIEFQGNIVCVDANVPGVWANPPVRKVSQPIVRATDITADEFTELIGYISRLSPLRESKSKPVFESLLSLLAARRTLGLPLGEATWLGLEPSQLSQLDGALEASLKPVLLPTVLIARHAGISPHSMQRLTDFFKGLGNLDGRRLAPPESRDSANRLAWALSVIDAYLGGTIGSHAGRQMQLAILLVSWMRGLPLAVLISQRVAYRRENDPKFNLASTIREVMTDIEQIARFEAPLYLSCYRDLLQVAQGVEPTLDPDQPDISMMLELGVSRTTELSALAIGISRTSAVALSDYIVEDGLSPAELRAWIESRDLDAIDLPAAVRREVRKVVNTRSDNGQALDPP